MREERSGDEEERKAEKVDEKKKRSETGVWGGTFTGHLEFAAPPAMALEPPSRSSALSPLVPCGPVSPRLEAPTVHPRPRQISLASRTSLGPPLRISSSSTKKTTQTLP